MGDARGDEEENWELPKWTKAESKGSTLYDFQGGGKFSIMSLNARSVNNKFQKIRDAVHKIDPSVLCIQETWGQNSSTDYSIKGFHKPIMSVRKSKGMNAGGGVAFWIKDSVKYAKIKSPFEEKELETISIALPDIKVVIINVYRGFGDVQVATDKLTKHIDDATSSYKGYEMVIVGDLNVDLLRPNKDSDFLTDQMQDRSFRQMITLATRETDKLATLIDHIYVRTRKKATTTVVRTDISDHYITHVELDHRKHEKSKSKITKRFLKKDDYEKVRLLLKSESWECMTPMSPDQAATYLSDVIIKTLDLVCKTETKELATKPINQWNTQGTLISLKRANELYKKARKGCSESQRVEYLEYKTILDKVIKEAKNMHYKSTLKEAGKDSRKLWGTINEIVDRKQCRHKMPDKFVKDGKTISGNKNIANAFNDYFASIGKEMADSLPTEMDTRSILH